MAEGDGEEQTAGAHISTSDVFISYASQDAALAGTVVAALERQGLTCWIAPRDVTPGTHYASAIVHAIDAAKVIVLILSKNAAGSPHVLREVERATSKRHPVVSVRIDQAPLPAEFEYFLNTSQWLDAIGGDTVRAMPKLVAAVRLAIERSAGPAPAISTTSAARSPAFAPGALSGSARSSKRTAIVAGAVAALTIAGFAVYRSWHPAVQSAAPPTPPLVTATPPAVPAALAIPEESVAVLPFVDMSEKKDQEYLCDGLSEELLDLLSRVPELHVAARTSSFSLKESSDDVQTIARKLHVATILEGSIRKSGNSLRITVQLVRAENGYHVWSQSYNRKMQDIFKIQDDIAASVVQALKLSLLQGSSPTTVVTNNTEAYTTYLRGEAIWKLATSRKDVETVIDYARKVNALDSRFAPAWVLLSKAYARRGYFEYAPRPAAYNDARRAALTALQLAPNLPEAHTALVRVLLRYDFNFMDARAHVQLALGLDPNNVSALESASDLAQASGDLNQSIKYLMTAIAHDPLNTWHYFSLARLQLWAGNINEARSAFRKMKELNPKQEGIHWLAGTILLADGDPVAALAEVSQEPNEMMALEGSTFTLMAMGKQQEADATIAEYENKYATLDPNSVAAMYAVRGATDKAFDWLDRAYDARDADLIELKVQPHFNSLRTDPRYQAFLTKMNML